MTPEAQRIAIAEACGFECDQHGHESRHWHSKSGQVFYLIDLPNYPGDLNAMAEAEKVLTREQHGMYAYWIQMVTNFKHDDSPLVCIGATAAQRAEAFLRTLGQWDDSK